MMKSKWVGICIVSAVLFNISAFASTKEQCHFIPENDLNIPVGQERMGGLDEATFNQVIDEVIAFYEPIIRAKGGNLKMNRLWQDGTVNASAQRQGGTWVVNMYGGLARHSATTKDGFALVLCHELGHHLGGFPKAGGIFSMNRWASNEGQSDYFATMKCFRRVYEKEDNAEVISSLSIPKTMKLKCSKFFKSTNEINLCLREAMAGMDLANLLWSLSNAKNGVTKPKPNVDTPSTEVVSKTDNSHPEAQCRLDTYFAGSICPISYTQDFGSGDAVTGACAMERGDKSGFRPLCWYKPQN